MHTEKILPDRCRCIERAHIFASKLWWLIVVARRLLIISRNFFISVCIVIPFCKMSFEERNSRKSSDAWTITISIRNIQLTIFKAFIYLFLYQVWFVFPIIFFSNNKRPCWYVNLNNSCDFLLSSWFCVLYDL